jgi:pyruvate/2-oxoglutarate dehydrogenase complex dihydrolipoamide dehydrogenase (E3) component
MKFERPKKNFPKKKLFTVNRTTGEETQVTADEILIASGRGPYTDILHPAKGGEGSQHANKSAIDENEQLFQTRSNQINN